MGHVLSYLPDTAAVEHALVATAAALLPGGVFALDLCDLRYRELRRDEPNSSRVADDWAIVTRFGLPEPIVFVRAITAFVRTEDGTWRRDDERHENILVDTTGVPTFSPSTGSKLELRGLRRRRLARRARRDHRTESGRLMAAAFGWGTLAASSLVIGALVALRFRIGLRVIGLIMAFGAGVLISAVAFDLVEEAVSKSGRSRGGRLRACSPAARSSSAATG